MGKYKIYRPESKFGFGQYADSTIDEIITKDPDYVQWCAEEVDGFVLDEEAALLLDIELDWRKDLDD